MCACARITAREVSLPRPQCLRRDVVQTFRAVLSHGAALLPGLSADLPSKHCYFRFQGREVDGKKLARCAQLRVNGDVGVSANLFLGKSLS